MSLIQTSRLPPKDQQRPLGEVAPHSLRTSELQTQETNIHALRIPATKRPQTFAVPRGHRPRLNCGDLIIIIIIIISMADFKNFKAKKQAPFNLENDNVLQKFQMELSEWPGMTRHNIIHTNLIFYAFFKFPPKKTNSHT
jgi:hypothetical protein